jgi:hemerythrin-like metal-binding protein
VARRPEAGKAVLSPRMDVEHEVLSELIESIGGICSIGNASDCRGCILLVRDKCHEGAGELMNALAGYMSDHFRYEERLMEAIVSKEHVGAHEADHHLIRRRLIARMDEFKRSSNTAAVSHLLVAELKDWITHHIQAHDAVLASYIASEENQ